MKIVHTADLHLDSPLRGLRQYEGAPLQEVRSATRRTFEALIDLCLYEQASLLLIAGDLYDGDFKDYSTALFFHSEVMRLRDAGVEVVWLRGNHDAANHMTKHLRAAPHVHELGFEAPETRVFERLGVAVHGQGYARRDLTENIALGYPAPLSGLLNCGLLHTAIDGREGHAPYAPCTLGQLTSHGYDYWALGHVHNREVLSERPFVVFPGNPQGRHIKETGPKGCTVIEIENATIISVEHRILDQVRWEACEVDVSEAQNLDDVLMQTQAMLMRLRARAGGRTLATRVRLVGRSPAHGALYQQRDQLENELLALAVELGDVYLESVKRETWGPQLEAVSQGRDDALGQLFHAIDEVLQDADSQASVWKEVVRSLERVPNKFFSDPELEPGEVLRDAKRLLEARLFSGGSDS